MTNKKEKPFVPDIEFKENVYVQFLGFSANPEYQPPPELLAIEKKLGGQVWKANSKLPEGFRITHAMPGDYYLKYNDEAIFRIFWIKGEDGKWYNYTFNRDGTPEEEWKKWTSKLPWHKNS